MDADLNVEVILCTIDTLTLLVLILFSVHLFEEMTWMPNANGFAFWKSATMI